MTIESPPLMKGAVISVCGKYRYSLSRRWDRMESACCYWIMLNPSTADAEQDDPTIRKCIGFAKRWGFGAIHVLNLFALRSTDPDELRRAADPVGPENDRHLLSISADAPIVAAWGAWGNLNGRSEQVRRMLYGRLHSIGRLTIKGEPRHPLYLPYDTPLMLLRDGAAA